MALHIPDFLYPVGEHTQLTLTTVLPLTRPTDATHLAIQVTGQVSVRVVVDGVNPATPTFGFQITAGYAVADCLPVTSVAGTVSICSEGGDADVQYQWLTRYRAGGG